MRNGLFAQHIFPRLLSLSRILATPSNGQRTEPSGSRRLWQTYGESFARTHDLDYYWHDFRRCRHMPDALRRNYAIVECCSRRRQRRRCRFVLLSAHKSKREFSALIRFARFVHFPIFLDLFAPREKKEFFVKRRISTQKDFVLVTCRDWADSRAQHKHSLLLCHSIWCDSAFVCRQTQSLGMTIKSITNAFVTGAKIHKNRN